MGSSFANVHVRIGARDPEVALEQVSAGIVDWLEQRGFGLIDTQSEADRTVTFGIDPGGLWINVYDETTDIYGDHGAMGSLAAALASRGESYAIVTRVFDSDLAWLALFDAAGQIAELVHGEEMDESGQFVAKLPPDYDRWASLLMGDASVEDLRRIWTARSGDTAESYVSADDRAADACQLLGIEGLRATTG